MLGTGQSVWARGGGGLAIAKKEFNRAKCFWLLLVILGGKFGGIWSHLRHRQGLGQLDWSKEVTGEGEVKDRPRQGQGHELVERWGLGS